jgi:hypothetical protein
MLQSDPDAAIGIGSRCCNWNRIQMLQSESDPDADPDAASGIETQLCNTNLSIRELAAGEEHPALWAGGATHQDPIIGCPTGTRFPSLHANYDQVYATGFSDAPMPSICPSNYDCCKMRVHLPALQLPSAPRQSRGCGGGALDATFGCLSVWPCAPFHTHRRRPEV